MRTYSLKCLIKKIEKKIFPFSTTQVYVSIKESNSLMSSLILYIFKRDLIYN